MTVLKAVAGPPPTSAEEAEAAATKKKGRAPTNRDSRRRRAPSSPAIVLEVTFALDGIQVPLRLAVGVAVAAARIRVLSRRRRRRLLRGATLARGTSAGTRVAGIRSTAGPAPPRVAFVVPAVLAGGNGRLEEQESLGVLTRTGERRAARRRETKNGGGGGGEIAAPLCRQTRAASSEAFYFERSLVVDRRYVISQCSTHSYRERRFDSKPSTSSFLYGSATRDEKRLPLEPRFTAAAAAAASRARPPARRTSWAIAGS